MSFFVLFYIIRLLWDNHTILFRIDNVTTSQIKKNITATNSGWPDKGGTINMYTDYFGAALTDATVFGMLIAEHAQ